MGTKMVINKKQRHLLYGVLFGVLVLSFFFTFAVLRSSNTSKSQTDTFLKSLSKSATYVKNLDKEKLSGLVDYYKKHGPRGYIVQSGSMEPSIEVGSIVISKPQSSYEVGDVVTFSQKQGSRNLVTHRIVLRDFPEGTDKPPVYQTKGDANEGTDPNPMLEDQIVGKVVYTIPHLGYIANYAKQPYGFILLVIVPATIVIYEELKSLFKDFFKGLKVFYTKLRKKKSIGDLQDNEQKHQEKKHGFHRELFAKSSIILPVFGCLLFFSGLATAFLNDREESQSNVLMAGVWTTPTITPTPTPSLSIATHLVLNEVLYDTSTLQNIAGQGGSNRGEFIEIYNPTLSSVNVANWVLADNNSSETLSGTIPALGYMIITGGTEAEFRAIWSVPSDGSVIFFQASSGIIGNGFANDGDRASLSNATPSVVDSISWGNDTTFLNPAPPDVTSGHSLERLPDGQDTNTNNDFVDNTTPTPGT